MLAKQLRARTEVTRQLRSLWALHAVRGLNESLALELLKHPEAHVRGWTIQLTSERRKLRNSRIRPQRVRRL